MSKEIISELTQIRNFTKTICKRLKQIGKENSEERYANEIVELETSSWNLISQIEEVRRSVDPYEARIAEGHEFTRAIPDTPKPKREVVKIGGVFV